MDPERHLFRTETEALFFSLAVHHQSTRCIKRCEVSHADVLQAA